MGLYKGLYLEHVDPLEVHTWKIEGTLAENIERVYEGRPVEKRGGAYYPWFQRNPHIL